MPSSAGLSDINVETDATTEDEKDALWNDPISYKMIRPNDSTSLGLSLVDYSEISHRGFDLPRGTYVKAVDDGSPAQQAGLKFGDRIIKVR
jgi:S1-C subfamily serine protease